tara:strand:+ start:49 stop:1869 length:1821 start_codon:yes stop_codon:yes gene_type:complete
MRIIGVYEMNIKSIRKFIICLVFTGVSFNANAEELTIIHINDHHSHLEANGGMDINLDGESTRVKSGGFASMVTKINELKKSHPNNLTLHAGDATNGTLYHTMFEGEADAALMNLVCFDAFVVGNHEFNNGDSGLVKFLDFLNDDECKTPVLGANVVPKKGVSALSPKNNTDYIKPYTIIEKNGQKIGIIGIVISKKTKMSSNPDKSTLFLDEIETAQDYATKLKNQGIDRIILLSHFGYDNEIELAEKTSGIDVIVGGDSHSLLGDFSSIGMKSSGPYPTIIDNRDGEKVCVVSAWEYSQIVGELNIEFDNAGNVISCAGTPHMMLQDSFKRKNSDGERVEIEDGYRDAVYSSIKVNPIVSIVEPNNEANQLIAKFSSEIEKIGSTVIGEVSENLCLERIPGQGKSAICNVSETENNGSDISNIVAQAFRDMSNLSDIAIQNGGGTRVDVVSGDYTLADAYTLLPFNNTIVELSMSGLEIKNVLEDALDYALSPDGSTGAYPYAAGLRWEIDSSKPKGERFMNLEYKGKSDMSWSSLNLDATYTVATNNYIASGRDGYLTFGEISDQGRVTDTYLGYAQSFVDYVKKVKVINKLPLSEYSTQSFK